jgi:hypothetical protein
MKLRCYVCGERLGRTFYLVTYQEDSDRVFVFGPECVRRAGDDVLTLRVVAR